MKTEIGIFPLLQRLVIISKMILIIKDDPDFKKVPSYSYIIKEVEETLKLIEGGKDDLYKG